MPSRPSRPATTKRRKQICAGILEQDAENAEALHLLGVLAYQVGLQAQEALSLIDRAIAADPTKHHFFNTRGALYYALGMNAEAEAAFRAAIGINPKDGTAWNNLGNALLRLDQVQPAQACFLEALNLAPDLTSAINNLGIALKREGELDKALACFRQAGVARAPTISTRITISPTSIIQLDDQPAAERHFRRAIEIDGNCAPGLLRPRPIPVRAEPQRRIAHRPESGRGAPARGRGRAIRNPPRHVGHDSRLAHPDDQRRRAQRRYERALDRAVTPESIVFEIGTGSGPGRDDGGRGPVRSRSSPARQCRSWPTARARPSRATAFHDRITVLSKRSTQVKLARTCRKRPTSSSRS